MMGSKQVMKESMQHKQKTELADAHCHLDLFDTLDPVRQAVEYGVLTIIGNGVDTKSNLATLERADNINLFAALGIDPEHALKIDDKEIDFNVNLIKSNHSRIASIGEIGLDYKIAVTDAQKGKQKEILDIFLKLAKELYLPVSLHNRMAFDDLFDMLMENKIEKAHFHFFDGNIEQAKMIAEHKFMVSIPPLKSSKRNHVLTYIPIEQIMGETDSPVVGSTPKDVEYSIRMIAEAKRIEYEKACEILSQNTKAFFNIQGISNKQKHNFMRY